MSIETRSKAYVKYVVETCRCESKRTQNIKHLLRRDFCDSLGELRDSQKDVIIVRC